MGARFRKSTTILPGVKMTVSKSGASFRVGPKGAGVSINTKGEVRASAGIPGTGIYMTEKLNKKNNNTNSSDDSSQFFYITFYDLIDLTPKEEEAFEAFFQSIITVDGTQLDDEKQLTVRDINGNNYEFSTSIFNGLYNKGLLDKEKINNEIVYSLNTDKFLSLKDKYDSWYENEINIKSQQLEKTTFGKKQIQQELQILEQLKDGFYASILHNIHIQIIPNTIIINKHLFVWIGAFLFGILGVDRFMRGQTNLGIVKLFIGSWLTCGIWPLIDWIIAMIKAYSTFSDTEELTFINGMYAR